MRKYILSAVVTIMFVSTHQATAQSKFEVTNFNDFKLHTYITADPLGDMAYIIEGEKTLTILEPAAFVENIKEMKTYIDKLQKPIEKVIVNYHVAGLSAFDADKYIAVEGMPEFVKGDVYSGMMKNFAASFGNAMDTQGKVPSKVIAKNSIENFSGVEFRFHGGATSDFPASSILIGKKVYYIHFTPVEGMHISGLQITGRDAVKAYLSELKRAQTSGATHFIGGHGIQIAGKKDVDFQVAYLIKMQQALSSQSEKEGFIAEMKKAFPTAIAEENLTAVADNLYK